MTHGSHTSLLFSVRITPLCTDLPALLPLAPVFPFPAYALHVSPHSSVICSTGIQPVVHRLRFPRLRPRLTQGRSALPWKPWIFGRKDSHLPLATHSGILSSISVHSSFRYCFLLYPMLLYQCIRIPASFGSVFQPRTFSAQDLSTSELLRTLLNVWLLLSQHPSWSSKSHILFHLTHIFGALAVGLGSFPFDCPTYLVQSDSHTPSYGIRSLIFFGKL